MRFKPIPVVKAKEREAAERFMKANQDTRSLALVIKQVQYYTPLGDSGERLSGTLAYADEKLFTGNYVA